MMNWGHFLGYQMDNSKPYYVEQVASEEDNNQIPRPVGPCGPDAPWVPVGPNTVVFVPGEPCGPVEFKAMLAVLIVSFVKEALNALLAEVTLVIYGGVPNGYDCILVSSIRSVYCPNRTLWTLWALRSLWSSLIYTTSCRSLRTNRSC